MILDKIPAGKDVPWDMNVIIEVPQGSAPVKYEMDKDSGALFVDRFVHTSMVYPCHYGFIPQTLGGDGDPLDMLVIANQPLIPGCVLRSRPVGVLLMEDDGGQDEKLLAVPVNKMHPYYANIETYQDLPEILLNTIQHFFEHYKDLEKGKWVKIIGWKGPEIAAELIQEGIARYKS